MPRAVVHLMELTGRGILDVFILEIGNQQFCSIAVVKIHGQMELVVQHCHQVRNVAASAKGNGCKLVAVQKQPCAKVGGFSGDVDFLHFPAVVAGISPDFLYCFGNPQLFQTAAVIKGIALNDGKLGRQGNLFQRNTPRKNMVRQYRQIFRQVNDLQSGTAPKGISPHFPDGVRQIQPFQGFPGDFFQRGFSGHVRSFHKGKLGRRFCFIYLCLRLHCKGIGGNGNDRQAVDVVGNADFRRPSCDADDFHPFGVGGICYGNGNHSFSSFSIQNPVSIIYYTACGGRLSKEIPIGIVENTREKHS